MSSLSQTNLNTSIQTSPDEGPDLGELVKLWRDSACSEERLKLMTELRKKKLGFNEIEKFSLGLEYNLKSTKLKDSSKPTQKVVAAVMEMKMRDESQHLREMKRKKEKMRRLLEKTTKPKTYKYKKIIKELRTEAEIARKMSREKYRKKLNHLEMKYGKTEEEEDEPPIDMEKFSGTKCLRK